MRCPSEEGTVSPALREGLLGNKDKGVCDGNRSQWAGEDQSCPGVV